jgi:ABC-2 type transport system permease protein
MVEMKDHITGLWTILSYTLRKLLVSKRIFITLLIALFVGGVMAYATTQKMDRQAGGTDMLDNLVLSFFMPVMAMIYGSSLVRDEMDDRSITQVVTSPMDRMVTYAGYYLGLAASVCAAILLVLTTGFLVFFGALGFGAGSGHVFVSMAALVVIGSFAYSALFIIVSVLISHPIYFGLLYAFIWEGYIGSIPGNIRLLAVKHYVRSLGAHWIDVGTISSYNASTPSDAALVLVVLTAVLLVLGAIVFREKEFP